MTISAIASTTTTALGTITGSCLPLMVSSLLLPVLSTVCWGSEMDGVGFIAHLNTISEPSDIPPNIPPGMI